MIGNKWSVLVLFLVQNISQAQILQGTVKDAVTTEPIPFANVYFNQSLRGVSTDIDGRFSIQTENHKNEPVVFSHLGYQSFLLEEFDTSKDYMILLGIDTMVLDELAITYKDQYDYGRKLARFKREFIGTSKNAKSCEIANPEVIKLVYDDEDLTLRAFARAPIIILNKALGYRITYFLKSFQTSKGSTIYRGEFFFEDQLDSSNQTKILKNRADTYRGSTMEVIRLLWNGSVNEPYRFSKGNVYKSSDFSSYRADYYENIPPISYSKLIDQKNDGEKYIMRLNRNDTISIFNSFIKSGFVTVKDSTLIDENGFFDPGGNSLVRLCLRKTYRRSPSL